MKLTRFRKLAIVSVTCFCGASPVLADRVNDIRAVLYSSMVENHAARELAKQCKSLSVKQGEIIKGATRTRDALLAKGYTQKELRKAALSVSNKAAKKAGKEWPIEMGASAGDRASYCTVGLAELQKKSVVGSYLRVK